MGAYSRLHPKCQTLELVAGQEQRQHLVSTEEVKKKSQGDRTIKQVSVQELGKQQWGDLVWAAIRTLVEEAEKRRSLRRNRIEQS